MIATLADALSAYRIVAQAEGRSPKTILWISSAVGYFDDFLGGNQALTDITVNDLRRFIITLQGKHKFSQHPFNKPQPQKLSPQSVETYARAIRAFFGILHREGIIENNPMVGIKMPRVPHKMVPTLSAKEVTQLLSQPDRGTNVGFRDYTLLLTFIDTAARLSEIARLKLEDVDLDNGYLRVMGKGSRERYVPIGHKLAKALLKYKIRYRPEAIGTDNFWLTEGGRELTAERVEKIVSQYGKKAGIKRCYPHKLRHTSSVLYLRNGGDPFTLQKKLGHSSLQMTRHYSNLADSDVRAQHLRYGVADRLGF